MSDGSDIPETKHNANAGPREPYQCNVNVDQSNAYTVDGAFGAKEGQQSTDVLQQEDRTTTCKDSQYTMKISVWLGVDMIMD